MSKGKLIFVRLSVQEHKALRIKCAKLGKSIQDVVRNLVIKATKDESKSS